MSKKPNQKSPLAESAELLAYVVDYLFPELNAYEAALYIYFFRKTLVVGDSSVRIGKRSIAGEFVHGKRGGGEGNVGGAQVNYQHITAALNGLSKKGCISIGDTTREGTLYKVVHPGVNPLIRNRMESELRKVSDRLGETDYFTDPLRRREVFERDHWLCVYCGERLSPENATIDHYVPQSKGGGNAKENLRTSCLLCNSVKTGKSYEEAAPLLLKSIADRRRRSAQGELPS